MVRKRVGIAVLAIAALTAWAANGGDLVVANGEWTGSDGWPIAVDGNVVVEDGGMFTPVSGVTFSAADKTLSMHTFGHLNLLAGLDLTAGAAGIAVDMNGVMMVGNALALADFGFPPPADDYRPAVLTAETIVLGDNARLSLDHSLMLAYADSGADMAGLSYTFLDAGGGSLTGTFSNLKNGVFVSFYGDFGIEVDTAANTAAIVSYAHSDYEDIGANIRQLNKMGFNGYAFSPGLLLTLNRMAVDSDSVDTNVSVAARLNGAIFEGLIGGMDYWGLDRNTGVRDVMHLDFGIIDNALMEYMNAATVNNVVHVNQRAAHNAADAIFDRAHAIGNLFAEVAGNVQSEYGYASAAMNRNYLNRFYVTGVGQWDRAKNRNGHSGYNYDGYGFSLGYDRMLGESFLLGGSFSYVDGDYEERFAASHDSEIANHVFNLYAAYYHNSGLFATVVGGYNRADNDINESRGGWAAREDYTSDTWYASGKVGYNWKPVPGFALTPSAGLGYIHTRAKSHDGNYAGVNNLRFGRIKRDSGFLPVELRAKYERDICAGGVLGITVKGGYTYHFDDGAANGEARLVDVVNAALIGATGRSYGHNQWNVGVGVGYRRGRWDFGASYHYVGQTKYSSHNASATVGLSF